ncbi:MAG: hypothetical protein MI808_08060 [Pseudomonadales bacterium]|nr:hypothetical protein [Pseudomonadales bacterium]
MLNCKHVAHKASDYVDENMSGWQKFWMVIHLFICANCRRFVNHVRVTRDFMSKRPSQQASNSEVSEVMRAINESDQNKQP